MGYIIIEGVKVKYILLFLVIGYLFVYNNYSARWKFHQIQSFSNHVLLYDCNIFILYLFVVQLNKISTFVVFVNLIHAIYSITLNFHWCIIGNKTKRIFEMTPYRRDLDIRLLKAAKMRIKNRFKKKMSCDQL